MAMRESKPTGQSRPRSGKGRFVASKPATKAAETPTAIEAAPVEEAAKAAATMTTAPAVLGETLLPAVEVTEQQIAAAVAEAATAPETEKGKTTMATKAKDINETMTAQAQTVINNGRAAFERAAERARETMDQGVKAFDEINSYARGNVEAVVAAGRAAAQGFETIAQTATEFSRKSFEDGTAALRTLSAAKTPNEFFQAQNDFAKTQFDNVVAEMSRLSETTLKVMGEVFEPLSSRMAVAVDRFAKPAR